MNTINHITNKKISISALHLAAFLLIYIINILLFFAFRGYFFLLLGIILTLLVPCSFYMAWRLADSIEGDIRVTHETVRPGEPVDVIVSATNRSLSCALHSTWLLTVGNSFFQTYNDQKILLSIPPRGTKRFPMTVSMTDLGRIVFTCKEYILTDLLGIFLIRVDCKPEECVFVLPKHEEPSQFSLPEAYSGAAELTESVRKGSDHSEVSDIRAYVPGDRPRDIHWKLSARQRELMVKERVSLSGSEHVLLLALPPETEKVQQLLSEGCLIVTEMIKAHMTVRLLVWNQHLYAFDSYSCGSEEELENAFCEIFRTELSARSTTLLKGYMANCYPQLRSYMCLTVKDDTIQMEICTNG
ncbi:DUF58 domain-containing protein [bacterium]|nr:DUF58 domain-containing protein [bacterium]